MGPIVAGGIISPPEIVACQGCNCGGMTFHHFSCSIFALPFDQQLAAVRAAEYRVECYVNFHNERNGLHTGMTFKLFGPGRRN
jgi:hypothetical protein